MHLSTVHSSRYYSGSPPRSFNATHCRNMTMPFLNVTNSTIPSNMSSIYTFTLHARDSDSAGKQGLSTMAIAGIIVGIAFGLIACALVVVCAIKSNRAAFAASGGRRGEVRRGNGNRSRTPADVEKGFSNPVRQAYGGNPAGMTMPSQNYGGSRTKIRCPGPRNGFVDSTRPGGGRSVRPAQGSQGRGPYADDTPYAATPTMEARGSERQGRNQYPNSPAPRARSQH